MNFQSINVKGKQIFKAEFSEIAEALQEKGIDINNAFELMADDNEMVYVSNGFVCGLKKHNENVESGEWHHYFKMVDGYYEAGKLEFKAVKN